ncbi:MAG: CBS domain-containing protein [Oscillospiraceae bacterium]|nr:CBS domain-containing protein [Oscillospiraceae bacterium]
MQVKDVMTQPAISISPEESAEVAARTLTQYNIGILPVCDAGGKLCGLVTDRDLVIRCMASGKAPAKTKVKDVMTGNMTMVSPDMPASAAADLMGKKQVRRLPVTEGGKLLGMVSLGDMAKCTETARNVTAALSEISSNPGHF